MTSGRLAALAAISVLGVLLIAGTRWGLTGSNSAGTPSTDAAPRAALNAPPSAAPPGAEPTTPRRASGDDPFDRPPHSQADRGASQPRTAPARRRVLVFVLDEFDGPAPDAAVELLELISAAPDIVWASLGVSQADGTGGVIAYCRSDRQVAVLTTSRLACAPVRRNAVIVDAGATPVELRFTHAAGRGLEGRVVTVESGDPLVGARVKFDVRPVMAEDLLSRALRSAVWAPETVTDRSGTFRFQGVVEPGRLTASAAGYREAFVGELAPADLTAPVELRLERRIGWHGAIRADDGSVATGAVAWVVGPKGAPLPGSEVGNDRRLWEQDRRSWEGDIIFVDAGARYFVDVRKDILSRRRPGQYRVEAEARGFGRVVSDWFTLGPESPAEGALPDLVLRRGTGRLRVLLEVDPNLSTEALNGRYLVVRRRSSHRVPVAIQHLHDVRDGDEIELGCLPDEPLVVGLQRVGSNVLESPTDLQVRGGGAAEVRLRLTE